MKNNRWPVTVMIPGDLHLTETDLPNHNAALWTVKQANNLIRPSFVQFIGDNVQNGTSSEYDLFRDLTNRLEVPWYALVGDHDTHGYPEAALFRKYVDDTYCSTSLGGFRFSRLNTQEARPVGLSVEQLGWFRAELDDAVTAGEKAVVFQHNYPYQIWEDFAGPGINVWREVVQTRPIHAIITGHTHYWQMANDGRNALVTTRSIGDPEGGPPGYALAFFDGDDFAITFRSMVDSGPLILITHPREAILATGPAHIVKGQDEVRAKVWSDTPVEVVGFRIDGREWMMMQPDGERTWRAPLRGDQLTKGKHRLAVRVEGGSAGEQEIEIIVDPTGRYTAVPMVHPVVTETVFC
jgi:Icc protein